jgi:hypothetical protein
LNRCILCSISRIHNAFAVYDQPLFVSSEGAWNLPHVSFKWIALTAVIAVSAFCLGALFWSGALLPRRIEKISFASCQWSSSEAAVYFANTGADELVIDKVWINGTLIEATNWEILPSMRLKPGDQAVLHVESAPMNFAGGVTYEFTLGTTTGNSFSYTSRSNGFTFMKTEELKVQSHTWATSRTSISITVKNTGTGAITISEWRVNDVAVSNVTYTTGAATLEAGQTAAARIAPASGSTFSSGVKYEFAALSATGNKYTYVATAP